MTTSAFPAPEAPPWQRPHQLDEDIVLVRNGAGEPGRANATLLFDGTDAVVVDTMLAPELTGGIHRELSRRGATARTVVNTHNHLDHLGGNMAFPDAEVLAHPRTGWIVDRMREDMSFLPMLTAQFADPVTELELRGPDRTAMVDHGLPCGAQLLTFEHAHSPADVAVWLPAHGVLVAGDLCFSGVTPLARHGKLGQWIAALDTLTALDPRIVVSGHGEAGTAQTLGAVRDYLAAVSAAAADLVAAAPDAVPDLLAAVNGPGSATAEGLLADAVAAVRPTPVTEWREPGRTRLNLVVGVAEHSGTELSLRPAKPQP